MRFGRLLFSYSGCDLVVAAWLWLLGCGLVWVWGLVCVLLFCLTGDCGCASWCGFVCDDWFACYV